MVQRGGEDVDRYRLLAIEESMIRRCDLPRGVEGDGLSAGQSQARQIPTVSGHHRATFPVRFHGRARWITRVRYAETHFVRSDLLGMARKDVAVDEVQGVLRTRSCAGQQPDRCKNK